MSGRGVMLAVTGAAVLLGVALDFPWWAWVSIAVAALVYPRLTD